MSYVTGLVMLVYVEEKVEGPTSTWGLKNRHCA